MSALGTSGGGGSGGRNAGAAAQFRVASTPAANRFPEPTSTTGSKKNATVSSSVSSHSATRPTLTFSHQPPQHQQFTFAGGVGISHPTRTQSAVRRAHSSSLTPTSSPVTPSNSEGAAAQLYTSPAADCAPGASGAMVSSTHRSAGAVGARSSQLASKDQLFSASIHAAAASNSKGIDGSVVSPGTGTSTTAALGTTSASAGPSQSSGLIQPTQALATATSTSEEAAKAEQRQQILGLVNPLLSFCSIGNIRVTSVRECTSSLFVLLYQRLFDCTIPGIDRSPNTAEKRRHNVALVLEQLRQHPYPIEDIEAEEVVQLNEDHISRLIMVFLQVAEDMRRQQALRQQQHQQQHTGSMVASIPSAVPLLQDAAVRQHPPVYPSHTEDFAVVKTTSGAYAPVGYTVAEVMQHPAAQQLSFSGIGSGGYHPPQSTSNFYVAPAPPLNGDAAGGGGAVAEASGGSGSYMFVGEAGREEEVEGSSSSATHYLDSSTIPRDAFMEEWQCNLVYPPAGSPPEDTEVMSAVDPGHVSLHGGPSQRRHPRSDRWGREAGVSLTSSGSPLYRTAQRRAAASPSEKRTPARHPSSHVRTQLDAGDIVHRFQLLEEALAVQERRHRKLLMKECTSPPAPQSGSLPERRMHEGHHRNHPASRPASEVVDSPPGAAAYAKVKHGPTELDAGVSLQAGALPPSQQYHRTSRAVTRRFVSEPPLTSQERYFLARCPQNRIDAAQRDSKIERLRSARYLGDMQQLLRRRMRREYDAQLSAMRGSLKESIRSARAEKIDLMRRVRDENLRYRTAFATLMEAAANEAQVPVRVMSRQTAQLADYYATALQQSHLMCDSLKRETDRRSKKELLRYAEEVSSWQQHFLL